MRFILPVLFCAVWLACGTEPPVGSVAAGKATDPFTNSAYHFEFDVRWVGDVPERFKAPILRAVNKWEDILRFNQLLDVWLPRRENIQIEGLPSAFGGEWVKGVILFVSVPPDLDHRRKPSSVLSVVGTGGPSLFRENNAGYFYPAKPLVGNVQISQDQPFADLYAVTLHEIAHVLGMHPAFVEPGELSHTRFDFLRLRVGDAWYWKGGMTKSIYGISGRAWDTTHVPMHPTTLHWPQHFQDLMAPQVGQSLTTLTLGFLADLGYVVDDEGIPAFRRRPGAAKPPAEEQLTASRVPHCGVTAAHFREILLD